MALNSTAHADFAKLVRKSEIGDGSGVANSVVRHKKVIDQLLAQLVTGEDAKAKLGALSATTHGGSVLSVYSKHNLSGGDGCDEAHANNDAAGSADGWHASEQHYERYSAGWGSDWRYTSNKWADEAWRGDKWHGDSWQSDKRYGHADERHATPAAKHAEEQHDDHADEGHEEQELLEEADGAVEGEPDEMELNDGDGNGEPQDAVGEDDAEMDDIMAAEVQRVLNELAVKKQETAALRDQLRILKGGELDEPPQNSSRRGGVAQRAAQVMDFVYAGDMDGLVEFCLHKDGVDLRQAIDTRLNAFVRRNGKSGKNGKGGNNGKGSVWKKHYKR